MTDLDQTGMRVLALLKLLKVKLNLKEAEPQLSDADQVKVVSECMTKVGVRFLVYIGDKQDG